MSQIDDDEMDAEATRDAIRALKELRDSPGWAILTRVANAQVKARTDAVMLSPRGEMKTEWDHEFKKGEVSGMRFLLELVDNQLETLDAVKDFEDDRDDDTADDTSSGPATDTSARPASFGRIGPGPDNARGSARRA
jgi:hypothetical protein